DFGRKLGDLKTKDQVEDQLDSVEEEQVHRADDCQDHHQPLLAHALEDVRDRSYQVGLAVAAAAALGTRFGRGKSASVGVAGAPHRATSCSASASRRNLTASSGGVGLTKNPAPQSNPAWRVSLGSSSMCQWKSRWSS